MLMDINSQRTVRSWGLFVSHFDWCVIDEYMFEIINRKKNFGTILSNFVVSIVPA